jgi:hypothetical protein
MSKQRQQTDISTLPRSHGRLAVNLPVDSLETIKSYMKKDGITATEFIRRAISAEKFLREQQEKGNEILIREKGNQDVTRIVMFITK